MEVPLAKKVTLIHEALQAAGVPHAIGGALALAYYGEPRVTIDVDINAFVPVERFGDLAIALFPLGVDVEVDSEQLARDGQVRLWWGRNPVDIFFAYDPFHDAMNDRKRRVVFGEGTIPILAPEHLIVCKAAFDRPKDWVDIEQMLVGVGELDRVELDLWLDRVLGAESERAMRVIELWNSTR